MRTKIKYQLRVPTDPTENRLDKFLTSELIKMSTHIQIVEPPQANRLAMANEQTAVINAISKADESTDFLNVIAKLNRSRWQDLIEKGKVQVNEVIAKASQKIQKDDLLEFLIDETPQSVGLMPANIPLDIVYEDQDLIVVNKPAGLVVHPAAGHEQDTLVNALLNHTRDLSMKNEERPGIVHRIDKETSGLLVVAKNDEAHERLAKQFKEKTSHRIYYAIAELPKSSIAQSRARLTKKGRIESFLARHPTDRKRYASLTQKNSDVASEIGKQAITHYEILEQIGDKLLYRLTLETGRTHQIRVHLKEMGSIIIGDTLYGFSKLKSEKLGLNRFFLHAAELGFTHPTTGDRLFFKSNWPEADLKRIREWGFQFEF